MVRTGRKFMMSEMGRHYGKRDLDRVGFFDDTPSGPFDEYRRALPPARNEFKGRQLLPGQPNDFFEKPFKRIFTGEVLQAPPEKKKVDVATRARVMLPTSPAKLHSTPNDWFGCIGKPPDYFSPAVRKPEDIKEGKKKGEGGKPANFKTRPNPIGGPGYVDICLNPYPKHVSEPYDVQQDKKGEKVGKTPVGKKNFLLTSAPLPYFPPNPYVDPKPGPTYVRPEAAEFKTSSGHTPSPFYVPFPKHPGGQHAGCFNKFPGFLNDPYREKSKDKKVAPPKFLLNTPNIRLKYTNSIISQITDVSCNVNNYRVYTERVYPLRR